MNHLQSGVRLHRTQERGRSHCEKVHHFAEAVQKPRRDGNFLFDVLQCLEISKQATLEGTV